MWLLDPRPGSVLLGHYPRPPVRCNAPASCAGQALRSGGALLIGAGLEGSACGVVASEQPALIRLRRGRPPRWSITASKP